VPQTIVTPTNTTAPPVTQVAGVAATPTRVAQVAGTSALPRAGDGPGSGTNRALVLGGIVLMLVGSGLFFAGRRTNVA
jgi:hypothetical protein